MNGSVKGLDLSDTPVIRFNNSASPFDKSFAILLTFSTNASKSPFTILAMVLESKSIDIFRPPLTSTYISLDSSVVSVSCSIVRLFVFNACNTRLIICCFSVSVIILFFNHFHIPIQAQWSYQDYLCRNHRHYQDKVGTPSEHQYLHR